ncbi:PAS domain S-box-containing protein/diguanylate cyclase (GGDEF) domain-containing protein [Roseateles sp. YR242]|uniref:diguanylate cyclase domain-containing protein n=1 Tax=Roseateles sp. YR242 TaxID=1855305 RepID=UPI0008BEF5B2|nr:diguanylate cyclase [Roseateles sp. YR242]SEK66033.1 PAS domain S-box-containing protein/diguanylate cyclase (GGDEF) domain-containing protein [Roseateles sp. YR242]
MRSPPYSRSPLAPLRMRRLLVLGPFLSLGLVLVVLWSLVAWFSVIYPRSLIKDVQDDLHSTAESAAGETDALLREAEGNLRTLDLMLLTRRTTDQGQDATVSLLADTLRESSRGLTDVMLANTDGRLWRIPSGHEPFAKLAPKSFLDELHAPGAPSVVVGAPLSLRPGGRAVLPLATRLSGDNGVFDTVVAFIDLEGLLRLYRARLQRQGMAIFLERDDGVALARLPEVPGLVGSNVVTGRPDRKLPPSAPAVGEFETGDASLDGKGRIVSYHSLQDYPLRVFVSLEEDRILSAYLVQRRVVLAFSLMVSVIAVGLMAWLTRLQQQARLAEAERQATADASPMGLFRADLDGRTVYANETYLQLLEVDRADLAWGWLERMPEDERAQVREDWMQRVREGESMDRMRRMQRPDGTEMVLAVRTRPMRVNGRVVAYAGTVLDVTTELAMARERERIQAVMSAVAHSAAVEMLAVDTEERVLFCNKTLEQRLHIAPRAWEGQTAHQLLGDKLYAVTQPLIQRALAGEASVVEWRDEDPDDRTEPRYLELSYAPLLGEAGGSPIGAYGVGRDVTDNKEEQIRLLKASNTDPLTELLNRAGFAASIQTALQRARDRGELVALLYLDLDRFKPVNDQYGHPVGDALLKAVAGRLRHALRPQDLVTRLGGDEFGVFLHHVAKPDDAQVVAEKLVHTLSMPFRIGALELHIGTSVGFCVQWARQVELPALVAQADAQLYHAKRAGRGRAQGSVCAADLDPDAPSQPHDPSGAPADPPSIKPAA